MILVYLSSKTVSAALRAAREVEGHIKEGDELFCPACGSKNLYFSRKSVTGSMWMEIEARCGACSTRFSLPDKTLQGFWRNGSENEESQPLRKLTGELAEAVV